jgi:uncharacterized membrane protein
MDCLQKPYLLAKPGMKTILPITSMVLSAASAWSLTKAWFDPEGRLIFAVSGIAGVAVLTVIAMRGIREFATFKQAHIDLKAAHIKLIKMDKDDPDRQAMEDRSKEVEEVIRKYFEP